MPTSPPELPALFTTEMPEPTEIVDPLDLRALRGYVSYDEDDGWPSMAFWDVEGTRLEFTAGIVGWPAWRELAATGAEHLAATATAFAQAIRAWQPPHVTEETTAG